MDIEFYRHEDDELDTEHRQKLGPFISIRLSATILEGIRADHSIVTIADCDGRDTDACDWYLKGDRETMWGGFVIT